MLGRLSLIVALALGVASGSIAVAPGSRGAGGCGHPDDAAPAGSWAEGARGAGLAALDRSRLVTVSGPGDRRGFRHPGEPGLLRHSTLRPGIGAAYVNDLAGPDVLVAMGPEGVTEIEGRGELFHPAWSPEGDLAWAVDLSVLETWSPASGARRLVPPPEGTSAVFSPVFTGPREVVAVLQEPVEGTHDDGLNDLWRYEMDAGRWVRLTRFEADGERWSVVRTPVVSPDGTVLFVRVHGRASVTEPPSFELWALRGGRASRLRELEGERYLAGFLDGRMVWNVFDDVAGAWRLVGEGPGGPVDMGCGAVSVDPRADMDPDLVDMGEDHARASEEAREPETGPGGGLALMVGDFESEEEAGAVAARLRAPGTLVVDHAAAPAAVRPGAWGVAVPLPPGNPPEAALARFRAANPDVAESTWVVPLGGSPPEVNP